MGGGGRTMASDANPMQSAHAAPRCQAHSKRTGLPCRAPAVADWRVCRLHGARGGHPAGRAHPSWKHGLRSQAWIADRRMVSELARETLALAARIERGTPVSVPHLLVEAEGSDLFVQNADLERIHP